MPDFDVSKAILGNGPMFAPFQARDSGVPLRDAKLDARTELLLMRWYGFCLSFSEARIYGEEEE